MTETRMKEESNEREGEMRQRNRSRPRLIPYSTPGCAADLSYDEVVNEKDKDGSVVPTGNQVMDYL